MKMGKRILHEVFRETEIVIALMASLFFSLSLLSLQFSCIWLKKDCFLYLLILCQVLFSFIFIFSLHFLCLQTFYPHSLPSVPTLLHSLWTLLPSNLFHRTCYLLLPDLAMLLLFFFRNNLKNFSDYYKLLSN